MRNLFVCLFVTMFLVSCHIEDAVSSSEISQTELEYKEKLENIITLKPLADSLVLIYDTSNIMKFKTYKEAFGYFYENKVFMSDTIIAELEINEFQYKNKELNKNIKSSSNSQQNTETLYYNKHLYDYANMSSSYGTGTLAANYYTNFNIGYGYYLLNGAKVYYTHNVSGLSVSSINVGYSGFGSDPRLIGSTIVDASGNSLVWLQQYEVIVQVNSTIVQLLFEVQGNIGITANYTSSTISPCTITHSISGQYI